MTELPPKAMKLLALALNSAAPDGEWNAAAIKAVLEMRKAGVPAEFFHAKPKRQPGPSLSSVMPFGKFKGQEISDLPDWYVTWIWDNLELREPLYSAIEEEINLRQQ